MRFANAFPNTSRRTFLLGSLDAPRIVSGVMAGDTTRGRGVIWSRLLRSDSGTTSS